MVAASDRASRRKHAGLAAVATLGSALVAATTSAIPALAASAIGHVSVTILPAATIGAAAMSFSTIAGASVPGQIVLDPAGTPHGPGAYAFDGTARAAKLVLTGAPNTAVSISISAAGIATGPGGTMPFRALGGKTATTSALDGDGVLSIALGAVLSVGRGQAPGSYSGAYAVTVDY